MYTGYEQFRSNDLYVLSGPTATSGSTIYVLNGPNLQEDVYIQNDAVTPAPVPIVFPKADPNWFSQGYPQTVDAGRVNGGLISYVPVSFFARNNGTVNIAFDPVSIYDGYINTDGKFATTIDIHRDFKAGEFVFAILLDRYAGAARYTMINNYSYWQLLSEVSNVQPGETVKKEVTITAGVTTEESKTFSTSIGSTVGFEGGVEGAEVLATISVELSESFSASIAIASQQTVRDSITFPAQEKIQRDALYQFIEEYQIIPGSPLKGWRDYLNGTSTEEARFFSSQFVCNVDQAPPFKYQSKYYATSYILEPN